MCITTRVSKTRVGVSTIIYVQQKSCAVIEHFTLANNLGIAFKVKFNLVTPKFEKKSVIFFLTVQSIMPGDIFIMISKGWGGGGAKINLVKPEFEILILFGGILSTLFIMIRSLWNS